MTGEEIYHRTVELIRYFKRNNLELAEIVLTTEETEKLFDFCDFGGTVRTVRSSGPPSFTGIPLRIEDNIELN